MEKEVSRNEHTSSSIKVKQPPIAAHLLVGLQKSSKTGNYIVFVHWHVRHLLSKLLKQRDNKSNINKKKLKKKHIPHSKRT